MIKVVKEQKKSQLKYYQMVSYTVKSLLSIKDILQTLPSSGINNLNSKRQSSKKQQWKNSEKWKKIK